MQVLPVTFLSTTKLQCDIPSHVLSHNCILTLSFDQITFTPVTSMAILRMFHVAAVHPRAGPIHGRIRLSISRQKIVFIFTRDRSYVYCAPRFEFRALSHVATCTAHSVFIFSRGKIDGAHDLSRCISCGKIVLQHTAM
jgi:hypothetical protein